MAKQQDMKIFLIDKSTEGPTATIVATALRKLGDRVGTGPQLNVLAPADLPTSELIDSRNGDVVLVSVAEPNLSSRLGGSGTSRVPCESLAVAQSLVNAPNRRVYLLRPDASSLTGIDVAASMLARIAGIADDRALLHDGILQALLQHHENASRTVSMLLVGRAAAATEGIVGMLEDWDMDLQGDIDLEPACWRAAMALAQLDELRPIRGPGHRYSFVKLAQALNLQGSITSFQLTESDLRKALSTLALRWLQEDADDAERIHLPRYARNHGFPSHQPAVAGTSDGDLPKRIYDIFKAARLIKPAPVAADVPHIIVRLQTQILRNRGNTSNR